MSLSRHHLSPDELHQPFPQLDGEEEDPSNPSVSDRVDPRIRWIYFGFGCVLLLPWNCAKLSQLWFHMFTYWPLLIPSFNHCYSIFRLPVKRVFISINLRIVPIILLHNRQFSFVDILDSHICTGMTSMSCAPLVNIDQSTVGLSHPKNTCIYYCAGVPNPFIDNYHLRPGSCSSLLFIRNYE